MREEIVFNPDGSIVHRTMSEQVLDVDLHKFYEAKVANEIVFVTPPLMRATQLGCTAIRAIFLGNDPNPGIAFRLEWLNFNTDWLESGGKLVPNFTNRAAAKVDPLGAKETNCLLARFPSFVEAWMVMYDIGHKDKTTPRAALVAIVSRPAGQTGPDHRLSVLPLPNTFDDGSLCLGSQKIEIPPGAMLVDLAAAHLHTWVSSPWNADLYSDEKRKAVAKLFAWTPAGERIDASNEDWWTLTQPASPRSDMVTRLVARRIYELEAT